MFSVLVALLSTQASAPNLITIPGPVEISVTRTATGFQESYAITTGGKPQVVLTWKSENLLRDIDGQPAGPARVVLRVPLTIVLPLKEGRLTRVIRPVGGLARFRAETSLTGLPDGVTARQLWSRYDYVAPGATRTFLPSTSAGSVLTDDRFLSPVAAVASPRLRAAIVPDMNRLADSRPMPASLAAVMPRAGQSAQIGYGFVNARRASELSSQAASSSYQFSDIARRLPTNVEWGELVAITQWQQDTSVSTGLGSLLWAEFGRPRLASCLPQTVPFLFYTRPAYDFFLTEAELSTLPEDRRVGKRQWWEQTVSGRTVGAPSGATTVSYGPADNALRAAWGLKWWGQRLRQSKWQSRAVALLNLTLDGVLGATQPAGAFNLESKEWTRPASFADLATTARWLLRWRIDFADAPAEEIDRALDRLTKILIGQLRPNGTYPAATFPPEEGILPTIVPEATLFLAEFGSQQIVGDASQRELARSAARQVQALSARATAYYADEWPSGVPLNAMTDAHALLASANLSNDASLRNLALRVARRATLEQGVLTLRHRPTMDLFGSFPGAGAYDGQTATIASSLLDLGASFQDRELMERGAAALRCLLGTGVTNAQLAADLEIPDAVPFGRFASSYGANETDRFGGWTSFFANEGQILASLADATMRYGDYYDSGKGWQVGLNGVQPGEDGQPVQVLWQNAVPYAKTYPIEVVRASGERQEAITRPIPSLRNVVADPTADGKIRVTALPGFSAEAESVRSGRAEFGFQGGQTVEAKLSERGWEADINEAQFLALNYFRAVLGDRTFDRKVDTPALFPRLSGAQFGSPFWTGLHDLADACWPSTVFPSPSGRTSWPMLSTGEAGIGRPVPGLRGEFRSREFVIQEPLLFFVVAGQGEASIELFEPETRETLYSFTAGELEGFEEVEWDLAPYRGRRVVLRLVDNDRRGWIAASEFTWRKQSR